MPDKFRLLLIPAILFCLLALQPFKTTAAPAKQEQLELQVKQMQDVYRDLTSLSFDFNQLTRTGGRERQGAGSAVFYRPAGKPGVMRWNYTEPDTQIILNDGSKLSIYTKTDNQLIVTSAAEMQSDITYAFFSGTSNLLDAFTVAPAGDRFIVSSGSELHAVQLTPIQPHAQIKVLNLWFDTDFMITSLIMVDHFDSITELSFSNIRRNTLPADSADTLTDLLKLDLPADTEIISQ